MVPECVLVCFPVPDTLPGLEDLPGGSAPYALEPSTLDRVRSD